MTRPALAAIVLALTALGPATAQFSPAQPGTPAIPFEMPKPLGGPIVGPDGKVLSAVDKVSPWVGGVDVGLNGSDGNVNILKFRTGFDLKHDDPGNTFLLQATYILSQQEGSVIEQKVLALTRDEMPFAQDWAYFAQASLEYDQFLDVDLRLAAHNGVVFTALNAGGMKLKLRAGLGALRQFGKGVPSEWTPEAQFGGDFDFMISNRTKLCLGGDYYPDVDDFGIYRVRARATLDILIDPELNMLLRLGVLDRYNSKPYNSLPNDVDYYISLLFRF